MYRYITLYIKYKTLTKFFRHPQRVAASLSIIQLRNSGSDLQDDDPGSQLCTGWGTDCRSTKETYCSGKDLSEVQLYRALNISRATYYRRKQKGIQYAGYFFYEAVLPDMEGLI